MWQEWRSQWNRYIWSWSRIGIPVFPINILSVRASCNTDTVTFLNTESKTLRKHFITNVCICRYIITIQYHYWFSCTTWVSGLEKNLELRAIQSTGFKKLKHFYFASEKQNAASRKHAVWRVHQFKPLQNCIMSSQNTEQLLIYANILRIIRKSGKIQTSHAHSPNSEVKVNTSGYFLTLYSLSFLLWAKWSAMTTLLEPST